MTINEIMRKAVEDVPAISDFFYADPDNVLSNVTTGGTPLFRLLRSNDTITEGNIGAQYNQNEVLMFTKVTDRTPEGDDEEATENELIANMFAFFVELKNQGLDFIIGTTPRWGRRQATNYALGLIVEVVIRRTFVAVNGCATGYYLTNPLENQPC